MMSEDQLEAIREAFRGAPDYNMGIMMLKEIDELRLSIQVAKRKGAQEVLRAIADKYADGSPMETWTDTVAESLRDHADNLD